jgi:hypothetical protein
MPLEQLGCCCNFTLNTLVCHTRGSSISGAYHPTRLGTAAPPELVDTCSLG